MANNMFKNPRFQMYGGPMVSTTSGLRPSAPNPGAPGFIGSQTKRRQKRTVIGANNTGQPTSTATGTGDTPVIAPKPNEFQGKLAKAMITRYGQRLPQSRTPWEAIGQGMPYLAAHYRQGQDAKAERARNQQLAQVI
jgi:hypothetical protein